MTALDGVSLHVDTGGVFGVIGTNGAGKTTMMRLVLGIIRPSAGSARVLGDVPHLTELTVGDGEGVRVTVRVEGEVDPFVKVIGAFRVSDPPPRRRQSGRGRRLAPRLVALSLGLRQLPAR